MERQQNVLSTLSYYPLSFSPLVRGREWAAIVLFTMIFVGLACEAGGDSSSDNNDANAECVWMSCSEDCPCPAGYHCDEYGDCREDKICGNGICSDDENCSTCPEDCGCGDGAVCLDNVCKEIETCGDYVCDQDQSENCFTCPSDCGCLKGELCNDDSVCVIDTSDPLLEYYWLEGTWKREKDGLEVEVEIIDYDTEKGAEVCYFSPWNCNAFIKKNPETSEFTFSVNSPDGTTSKGFADPETLTVEFDYCAKGYDCIYIVYEKM